MNKYGQAFSKGLIKENPVLRLVLGTCPTLAVTTAAINGLGMGAAATFVLVCSNIVISLLRRVIPDKVRLPAYIVIIAGFTTIVQMLVKAYLPDIDKALGIYLPLITTNCAVLGVALLNVQNDYNFISSVVYGITGGLGFLLAIFLFAAVREQLEVSSDIPKSFEGFPIALVTAGLMALAFMGFSGLKVW